MFVLEALSEVRCYFTYTNISCLVTGPASIYISLLKSRNKAVIRTLETRDVPSACYADGLAGNVAHERRDDGKDSACGFCGSPRSSQWDIRVLSLVTLPRPFLLLWDPECDLCTILKSYVATLFFGGGESGQDVAKCDGIGSYTKLRPPFFCDSLGQASNTSLADGVIRLPCVSVQSSS